MSQSIFVPGLLKGKAAFVTGGGSGIGAGIAHRLAEQGASVMLFGRTLEKLERVASEIRAKGGTAETFAGDVRDYALVSGAVSAAVEKLGRLDIVICSAAGNFLAPAAALSACCRCGRGSSGPAGATR